MSYSYALRCTSLLHDGPEGTGGNGCVGAVTSDESCARRGTSVQYILFATVSSHLVLPSAAFLQTRLVLLHVLLALQLQPPLAAYEMHSRLRHVSCACVRVRVRVGVGLG